MLGYIPISDAQQTESVLARYSFARDSLSQWKLPGKLREISGLAFQNGRLFAHSDEHGIVYELDYRKERLIKAFAFGDKTVRADFEGIAIVGDEFYMVTSGGDLYRAHEGDDGERVPYRIYRTGLAKRCEVEGLAHDIDQKRLLLACKEPKSATLEQSIAIFAWSLQQQQIVEAATIMIEQAAIVERLPGKHFNPSGIEVDRTTGHLLLVAARQRAIAEIDAEGNVIVAFELPLASRHRQPEAITLTGNNDLVLGDEGGKKKARLAVYRPES